MSARSPWHARDITEAHAGTLRLTAIIEPLIHGVSDVAFGAPVGRQGGSPRSIGGRFGSGIADAQLATRVFGVREVFTPGLRFRPVLVGKFASRLLGDIC